MSRYNLLKNKVKINMGDIYEIGPGDVYDIDKYFIIHVYIRFGCILYLTKEYWKCK